MPFYPPEDTSKKKSNPLGYTWKDSPVDPYLRPDPGPLFLDNPSNVEVIYELAPDGKGFYVYERVGGRNIRPPSYISYEDFIKLQERKAREAYFREQSKKSDPASSGLIPALNVNSELFKDIFGSGKISIRPNVSVLLDLSYRRNRIMNPNLSIRQQRSGNLNFNQQMQMSVVGNIGEKLKLRVNYDTESMFDFDRQFKVSYEGFEDDIIKKIEAGNVALPLKNSLIQGSQNLWGIKTEMQFGPVWVTAIASQQKSKTNEIIIEGGKQQTPFEIKASDYDYNRHFFLSHFFRARYEEALKDLPLVNSGINIIRVEVWVTNRSNASTTNTRNAVGFVDLGEGLTSYGGVIYNTARVIPTQPYPSNYANNLYEQIIGDPDIRNRTTCVAALQALGYENGKDFEFVENMRRLNENEYYVNRQLGYISLNTRLNPNDALFVAFEYTIAGIDSVFRVGEFSNDQPADPTNNNVLFLKMLKPPAIRPTLDGKPYPTWDLMMKNVYSLGAYNLSPDGFDLQIYYEAMDGSGDINYLPTSDVANIPLLQVFALDQLRNNMERGPDNRFDFIPNVTVIPDKGVIIFPVLEPFGSHLVRQFKTNREADSALYAFTPLYRMTQPDAVQYYPHLNRFKLKGTYQSAATGSEIFLNAIQITPGSVRVFAGGIPLQEGVDYTVDYNVGKVTILNQGVLSSGQTIRITFESNELFAIQQKSLLGARLEWRASKNFTIGGTVLHLVERPLVNKILIGDEPVANWLWGLDVSLQQSSKMLSRWLSHLPFYSTDAPSNIRLHAEFAQFIPRFPKQIRQGGDARGTAYIDDFEGARYNLDLSNRSDWVLASIPSKIPDPDPDNPLAKGFTRAKIAWYHIDPLFFTNPRTFGYDRNHPALNNHYSRQVDPREVFPNRTVAGNNLLTTFDVRYIPYLRGPYNYQTDPAKLNPDGTFKYPEENWAGIMRRTTGNTDFEAANFEYIEFWIMDPFIYNPNHSGGYLIFNLGRISEDILPDGRRAYEHGLPTNEADNAADRNLTRTAWGRVPDIQTPVTAFDNDPNARQFQDVGLDGLRDEDERTFFADYLNAIAQVVTDPEALARIQQDPSGDNFRHFSDDVPGVSDPSILDRYLDFNGMEGNSPPSSTDANQQFVRAATTRPDVEDINADGTLNTIESYWEYVVELRPDKMQVGQNYIVDMRNAYVKLPNGTDTTVRWYLFRIPLREGTPVGNIQDFKSIDFIRMYFTGFKEEIILRFGKFQLVALSWRRYLGDLSENIENVGEPGVSNTFFELGTLNIEENGNKQPFNYVIPPGVERQQIPGSPISGLLQNEQSMVIRVCDLQDGDARAAFKNVQYDFRFYERLRLFFHLEAWDRMPSAKPLECGDVVAFVRIGTDFLSNYYEYEVPLCPSDPAFPSDPANVWNNILDVVLSELAEAKFQRDLAVEQGQASYTKRFRYVSSSGQVIYVLGTPRLDQVKTIMIGVRNPSDDGLPLCVEVWFNELRVADFIQDPGYAANGKLNIQLADLGNLSLAGTYKTPYFGSLEQRIQDRSLEWNKRYDAALNIQLGKLLPERLGLQIPAYFTYSEHIIEPLYNPYNPDILTRKALEALQDPVQRREKFNQWITYRRTYSYSFNNVRWSPPKKKKKPSLQLQNIRPGLINPQQPQPQKPKQKKKQKRPGRFPWSLQNFAFTYGYSRTDEHTPQIEGRLQEQYRGAINYTYSPQLKPLEPFKRFGKKPNLISSFNLSLLPQRISAGISGTRNFQEIRYRVVRGQAAIPPVYFQDFRIQRNFSMQWNLTRSLRLQFNANSSARVDEPYGRINTPEKKDTLMENIFYYGRDPARGKYHQINIGRTLQYQHQLSATYQVPTRLIKPLDWINASATYQGRFGWQTAALQNTRFGNTINNGRTIQGNIQGNFANFYKKFKFIDELLKPIPKKNIISKSDSSRVEGDEPRVTGQRAVKALAHLIFSVKNVQVSYNRNEQTTLPGYMPRAGLMGLYNYEDSLTGQTSLAPGWEFVLGEQPVLTEDAWFSEAVQKGWITNDPRFAVPFQQTRSEQLNLKAQLQPAQDLTINVSFNRTQSESYGGLFGFDSLSSQYKLSNRSLRGNFSTSYFALFTAFESAKREKSFDYLEKEARRIISQRWKEANPNYYNSPNPMEIDGYWNGYLGSSQDVLIPAFLATYGPQKAEKIPLSPFPRVPLPNWDITYNGLTKLDLFSDLFSSASIRHSYRCTYTASYLLNLKAEDKDGDGFSDAVEPLRSVDSLQQTNLNLYNFHPFLVIQSVSITESFSPLLGINLRFDNGMSATVDFKRSRTITLNIGSLQISENRNTELRLAWNWKRQGMGGPITIFGKVIDLRNTITYRMEITLRNTRRFNRTLDSGIIQPIGGNFNLIIKPSVDYMINTQLTVRVYFEKNINNPVLSTSYPTRFTAFGIQARFTLTN